MSFYKKKICRPLILEHTTSYSREKLTLIRKGEYIPSLSLFSAVSKPIASSSMNEILIGTMEPKAMGSIAIKLESGLKSELLTVMRLRSWERNGLGSCMQGEKGFSRGSWSIWWKGYKPRESQLSKFFLDQRSGTAVMRSDQNSVNDVKPRISLRKRMANFTLICWQCSRTVYKPFLARRSMFILNAPNAESIFSAVGTRTASTILCL